MTREASTRLGAFIAGAGVLAVFGAYAASGAYAAWSAGIGAALAFGNFHAWRWLVGRIVDQRMQSKPALALLLVVKGTFGLGAVFALLALGWVAPLPFVLGVGALPVGMLVGSAMLVALGGALQEEG
jgi:hypothetical protein